MLLTVLSCQGQRYHKSFMCADFDTGSRGVFVREGENEQCITLVGGRVQPEHTVRVAVSRFQPQIGRISL